MSDALIAKLEELIDVLSHSRHELPISQRLWDAERVAEYLSVAKRTVVDDYAARPDFPRPIVLPTDGGKGTKRWKPMEIKAWADSRQAKKRSA